MPGTDRTENIFSIIACSVVTGATTCPQSCFLASAVVLWPVLHTCYLAMGLLDTVLSSGMSDESSLTFRRNVLPLSSGSRINRGTNLLSCWFLARSILRPLRLRRYVPLKRRLTFNGLHSFISQKIIFFITTAVRTHATGNPLGQGARSENLSGEMHRLTGHEYGGTGLMEI
jgi:hypothetical protein